MPDDTPTRLIADELVSLIFAVQAKIEDAQMTVQRAQVDLRRCKHACSMALQEIARVDARMKE